MEYCCFMRMHHIPLNKPPFVDLPFKRKCQLLQLHRHYAPLYLHQPKLKFPITWLTYVRYENWDNVWIITSYNPLHHYKPFRPGG